ncbi:MAG: TonB-dependent receptor [Gammaproteobacteria bacterium]|nr:MAG: TonB-dependent receptor [Gammaproteobacteria bacterium]
MMLKKLPLLISTLVATHAYAATDEIIVTGTYSPISAEQIASSVTTISQEQLLALSSHSLVDALRQVPSIWVEEQGGPGGLTAISLRGAESNHTLVMLDGTQLNDPTNTRGGAFDANNINIDSIKRIEIIRGAQSSIYGSDAVAGVIHIITIEPTKNAQQNLSASVGEDGYKTGSFSTTGTLDKIGYAVKLQSKDGGEPIKGSTAESKEALVKLNWISDAQRVDFTYRYLDGEKTTFPEQSGGSLFAVNRDLDHSEYTDQNTALAWQWQVNEIWRSKVQASWFNRQETLTSPGIIPYFAVPPNGSDTDFTRENISWVNTIGDEKSVWGNIGVETKHESGDSKGYIVGIDIPPDFALDRRINSAFINLNGYATENLFLQASGRHDKTENLDAKDTGQVGVRYQINSALSIFGNAGKGYKLPGFSALGHPLVGNPDLKPETATTRDVGFEWKQNNTAINISYFRNTYENLIDFDSDLFRNVNRTDIIDTRGVETEVHWHTQNNQWQLSAHASYADIDAQHPLMGRPQVKAGANVIFALNDSWQFNANYLWVDERFASSLYTGESVIETLDTYNRFDLGARWQATNQLSINVSIENITDEKYYNDVGFPSVGRSGFIGFNFNF